MQSVNTVQNDVNSAVMPSASAVADSVQASISMDIMSSITKGIKRDHALIDMDSIIEQVANGEFETVQSKKAENPRKSVQ